MNPENHRRSIRLKGYDYSRAGAYFVTICVQNRECLLGKIVGAGPCACPNSGPCACPNSDPRACTQMVLNDAGIMIQTVWQEIPNHYPGVNVDAFVVMPNHIHGIIILVGAGPCACPDSGQPMVGATPRGRSDNGHPVVGAGPCACPGQPQGVAPTLSLPDVVHRFKTMTTKRYAVGVKQHGWQPFPGRLWQRNYYEHIIRDDESLNRIRQYIAENPLRWYLDRENPNAIGVDDQWNALFVGASDRSPLREANT